MMRGRAEEAFDGGASETGMSMPELFRDTAEAKIKAVEDYIQHLLDLGTKFLLFGHHHSMLDALERKLVQLRVAYIRIDGSTSPVQRPERVEKFQKDELIRDGFA